MEATPPRCPTSTGSSPSRNALPLFVPPAPKVAGSAGFDRIARRRDPRAREQRKSSRGRAGPGGSIATGFPAQPIGLSYLNGRCFIRGMPAEVSPDRNHATRYACRDCGSYDLVEKDRESFEAWIQCTDYFARPQMALK